MSDKHIYLVINSEHAFATTESTHGREPYWVPVIQLHKKYFENKNTRIFIKMKRERIDKETSERKMTGLDTLITWSIFQRIYGLPST